MSDSLAMKLIIQVPCYNEQETLPETLADLPREVAGFTCVEWLVIDDGSHDRTVAVAREQGVDHIVTLGHNRGLAVAYMAGLAEAIQQGADVIVNTDADNQYCAADIPKLTEPILNAQADLVVGCRAIAEIEHFSPIKKALQKLGSKAVRMASRTTVQDAPSGFRAITRDAAMQLNVFNRYTYTLETIIQAGQKGLRVESVPIRTNGPTRPSRLVKSIRSYVSRSIATIFRIFVLYRPLAFFFWVGTVPIALGLALFVRWVVLWLVAEPYTSRVPSLVLGAVLLLAGFMLWCFGLIADLLASNRRLIEDCQLRLRRLSAPPRNPHTAEADRCD